MKIISGLLLLSLLATAHSATIAIIDSGMDYKHEMLAPHLWINENSNQLGPYQNAKYGWNFAEQNNEIIDYQYLNTFSADVRTYYELQSASLLRPITDEELAWATIKQEDKKFVKELDVFGNFIHGTHVAGIAVKNSQNKVMGIKMLPTEVKARQLVMKSGTMDNWLLLEYLFAAVSKDRMKSLGQIASFASSHGADVANCSFGTGIYQAAPLASFYFNFIFKRQATDEELVKAAVLFLKVLNKEGGAFVGSAPKTLFVFAAGNDGLSNDLAEASPASIRANNTISVAATFEDQALAPFSNFGIKTVDVAAPGMLINSAIPGNEYLRVSGTSQAAPFVANVAGKIKDANPKLIPEEIKNILIETVDKKSFLTGRVASGGMVNEERAVLAAKLSSHLPLKEAIGMAKSQVAARKSFRQHTSMPLQLRTMPMPGMFSL